VKMLLFRHRNPRLHLLSYTRRSFFISANEVASEAKKSGHTSKLSHYCSYNMPSFLKNQSESIQSHPKYILTCYTQLVHGNHAIYVQVNL
jgi:hypothetical protein